MTDEQINRIRNGAGEAGDFVTVVLCDAALGCEVNLNEINSRYDGCLSNYELRKLSTMDLSREGALAILGRA